jgi:hypothetical protein
MTTIQRPTSADYIAAARRSPTFTRRYMRVRNDATVTPRDGGAFVAVDLAGRVSPGTSQAFVVAAARAVYDADDILVIDDDAAIITDDDGTTWIAGRLWVAATDADAIVREYPQPSPPDLTGLADTAAAALALLDDNTDFDYARGAAPSFPSDDYLTATSALRSLRDSLRDLAATTPAR